MRVCNKYAEKNDFVIVNEKFNIEIKSFKPVSIKRDKLETYVFFTYTKVHIINT